MARKCESTYFQEQAVNRSTCPVLQTELTESESGQTQNQFTAKKFLIQMHRMKAHARHTTHLIEPKRALLSAPSGAAHSGSPPAAPPPPVSAPRRDLRTSRTGKPSAQLGERGPRSGGARRARSAALRPPGARPQTARGPPSGAASSTWCAEMPTDSEGRRQSTAPGRVDILRARPIRLCLCRGDPMMDER